jgi:hypothetical protein
MKRSATPPMPRNSGKSGRGNWELKLLNQFSGLDLFSPFFSIPWFRPAVKKDRFLFSENYGKERQKQSAEREKFDAICM